MAKATLIRRPSEAPARARRGYFECRYGQLHVHHAMPPGGGFEESTPLLCLHDLPGSGRIFSGFLGLLGRERSAYAPDLPGFGGSDPPAARPTIADYAGAIGDFIESIRLRRLDVLGLRGGALIATELATTRPAQIRRVVMVSVPLRSEAERQAAAPPPTTPPGPDDAYRSPEWLHWALDAASQYRLRERLALLAQPLLVMRPRDDLWEATARVREALPQVRTLDLDAGGTELFAAAPQRLADVLGEFLRG
ncbi:MAG TPA: alpha/beta hydrolase [Steroidobacteraceae bacterium]|nr:alpha/beta hydrolase [Steroidobacteraceae bacterium]